MCHYAKDAYRKNHPKNAIKWKLESMNQRAEYTQTLIYSALYVTKQMHYRRIKYTILLCWNHVNYLPLGVELSRAKICMCAADNLSEMFVHLKFHLNRLVCMPSIKESSFSHRKLTILDSFLFLSCRFSHSSIRLKLNLLLRRNQIITFNYMKIWYNK